MENSCRNAEDLMFNRRFEFLQVFWVGLVNSIAQVSPQKRSHTGWYLANRQANQCRFHNWCEGTSHQTSPYKWLEMLIWVAFVVFNCFGEMKAFKYGWYLLGHSVHTSQNKAEARDKKRTATETTASRLLLKQSPAPTTRCYPLITMAWFS
jgi:hypothetical protein